MNWMRRPESHRPSPRALWWGYARPLKPDGHSSRIRGQFRYSSFLELDSLTIVNGQNGTPLVFIADKTESFKLPCLPVSQKMIPYWEKTQRMSPSVSSEGSPPRKTQAPSHDALAAKAMLASHSSGALTSFTWVNRLISLSWCATQWLPPLPLHNAHFWGTPKGGASSAGLS